MNKHLFNFIVKSVQMLFLSSFKYFLYAIFSPRSTKQAKWYKLYLDSKMKVKFTIFHFKQMYSWTQSKQYKQQYSDTQHPYPPLLNPETTMYIHINAQLAWALNLPLPMTMGGGGDKVYYGYGVIYRAYCYGAGFKEMWHYYNGRSQF